MRGSIEQADFEYCVKHGEPIGNDLAMSLADKVRPLRDDLFIPCSIVATQSFAVTAIMAAVGTMGLDKEKAIAFADACLQSIRQDILRTWDQYEEYKKKRKDH
jgi:hypothetical protein